MPGLMQLGPVEKEHVKEIISPPVGRAVPVRVSGSQALLTEEGTEQAADTMESP